MARFLTLRGAQDGRRVATVFAERGLDVSVLPLQHTIALEAALPQGPWAGVLATSRHAASWLGRHERLQTLPALAVGAQTAAALTAAGFRDVRTGEGTAAALLPQAREIAGAGGDPILYAAGRVRRPETEVLFGAAGVPLRTVEVYDTQLRQPSSAELDALAVDGGLAGVLLLSVAQAACFAGFAQALGPVRLLCLSPRIRDALPPGLQAHSETVAVPTLAALAEQAARGQEARRMP